MYKPKHKTSYENHSRQRSRSGYSGQAQPRQEAPRIRLEPADCRPDCRRPDRPWPRCPTPRAGAGRHLPLRTFHRIKGICQAVGTRTVILIPIHTNVAGRDDRKYDASSWCSYTTQTTLSPMPRHQSLRSLLVPTARPAPQHVDILINAELLDTHGNYIAINLVVGLYRSYYTAFDVQIVSPKVCPDR